MKYFYVPADDNDGPVNRMNTTSWPRECELAVCDDGGFRLAVEDDAHDLLAEMSSHYRPWNAQAQPLHHSPSFADECTDDFPPDAIAADLDDDPATMPDWAKAPDSPPIDEVDKDDLERARAAIAQLPAGPITDADLARVGVSEEEFARLADADMDEEIAQYHAATRDVGPRGVALDFLPEGYFAVADCQDCEGSGLVETEMAAGARATDTCDCVFEDAAAGEAPSTASTVSSTLDDSLASAEAACERIDAATAHTLQGRTGDTTEAAFDATAGVQVAYVAESRGDVDGRGL